MKKTILNTLGLLRCNWRAILLFELVYRSVLVALVGPVDDFSYRAAMKLEGFSYLTHENIGGFMSCPSIILVAVLLVICLAVYVLIDIAALHYIFALSQRGERAYAMDATRFAVKQLVRALRPRNLLLFVFTLLIVPLLSIGVIFGLVYSMETPELFFEHMSKYTTEIMFGAIGALVSVVLLFRLMFTFAYAFFDGESFFGAVRMSWRASRRRGFGDLISVLLMQVLVWAACFAVLALVGVPVSFLLPSDIAGMNVSRATLLSSFVLVPLAVGAGLLVNAPTSISTVLTRLALRGEGVSQPTPPESLETRSHRVAFRVAVGVVALVCVGSGAFYVWTNTLQPMAEFKHTGSGVTITAHRGGGANAPENTLAAFQRANEDGADSCELDVQMSKDGVVFVSHDSDFHRISKVDKSAWELTYDEIRQLDATGDKWQGKFERQHYPTLDEVLDWATTANMHMNIELKPTGHETNFEQAVVDIIHAHNFVDNCIVTSQVYETIRNVGKCDSNISCVYVARFLYGDVSKMEGIDIVSVEENSVTPELSTGVIDCGKAILTWTVNSPRGVERAIIHGTDNVITDDVPMAKSVIQNMA